MLNLIFGRVFFSSSMLLLLSLAIISRFASLYTLQRVYMYIGVTCRGFLCMHKIFRRMLPNGQYGEGSFTERNPDGMFVLSTVTVRFLYDGIRPTKLLAHLNDLRTYIVTY